METNNKHLFELAPNEKQRDLLKEIFAGPELLIDLLESEENPPKNLDEIRFFLLKNKVKIYPYISSDIENNVDILYDVIYRIIQSRAQGVRLDFLGNCSLSMDSLFYFPIKGLCLIHPADSSIKDWRISLKGRRYIPAFSIIKQNNKFFAEIEFEQNFNNKIISYPPKLVKAPPEQRNTTNSSRRPPKKKMSYFDRKIHNAVELARFSFRQKPSDHHNSENSGSIWTVSGGLPSLGRNR